MPIDRYHYDEIFLGAPDDEEDEEFPDVTDDREPDEPEPRPFARRVEQGRTIYEEDFLYDPLSRKGWD